MPGAFWTCSRPAGRWAAQITMSLGENWLPLGFTGNLGEILAEPLLLLFRPFYSSPYGSVYSRALLKVGCVCCAVAPKVDGREMQRERERDLRGKLVYLPVL